MSGKTDYAERVTHATEGMTVWTVHVPEATVSAACDGSAGVWACSTHHKTFHNNLEASSHEYDGHHVVYWHCPEHGAEAG